MVGAVTMLLLLVATVGILAAVLLAGERLPWQRRRRINPPPAVPGLPLIGNLLQLKEKKPHMTFSKWAESHGPIYSIRTGASMMVVINSAEIAKEAMVTRLSSISTRMLSKVLTVLTRNKCMVAMSDYGEFHKMVKRYLLKSTLGSNAQKQFRGLRDQMISNVIEAFYVAIREDPGKAVNLREVFESELFRLALIQALGVDVDSVYVAEFNREISKKEMLKILVADIMNGALEVDWRDFFPYLRWIPNKSVELKIGAIAANRMAVMRALINEQKKRIACGDERSCYLDFLVLQNTLTEDEVVMLVWEAIITSDTILATTEWAMYELAKNQTCAERLYHEIQDICGSEQFKEEHLSQSPYLNAIFHETLRRYSPTALIPPRFAHTDTQLAGFDIPSGTQIMINIYGCNMNKADWDEPDRWIPDRFLKGEFEPSDPHKTMAFGAGKRACAGILQATLISCVSIARFIQEFKLHLGEGEDGQEDTDHFTTCMLRPLRAYLSQRQKASDFG